MRFALSLCALALLPAAASGFRLSPRLLRGAGCEAARSSPGPRAQAPESEPDVDPSVEVSARRTIGARLDPSEVFELAWQRSVLWPDPTPGPDPDPNPDPDPDPDPNPDLSPTLP